MPLLATSEFSRPKDDQEFEDIVRDIFAAHWKDDNTQRNGRSGQKQFGVDIYGKPTGTNLYFGIQCKLKNSGNLSKNDFVVEIGKARLFQPKLDTYIFVTSLSRDAQTQEIIRQLNEGETQQGGFKIQIRFWEDICALLAEHPRLVDKYYKEWGYPKNYSYNTLESRSNEITENSPLLIGVVVDVSNSVKKTLERLPNQSGISSRKFYEVISLIKEKLIASCKAPESEKVLPLIFLFVYGFGFGAIRRTFAGFAQRLGFQNINPEIISSAAIRDLFAETSMKESLPKTPATSELQLYWDYYKKSIEAQFLDIASGPSILYEALCIAHDRFFKELEKPYCEGPILLIISDGQLDKAEDEDLMRIVSEIRNLGVQIVSCYVGTKNITRPKTLYSTTEKSWPVEAKRLFNCASSSGTNKMLTASIDIAKEKGWSIPEHPKMFIQANQGEMLKELIEILLKPLSK